MRISIDGGPFRRIAAGFFLLTGAALLSGHGAALADDVPPPPPFEEWLRDLKAEAMRRGISEETLTGAFQDVAPLPKVLEYDRSQPEFTRTFWQYLERAVTDGRIERGRALMREHRGLLTRVESEYGVQARFLVAFWGLETNFGDYTGGFPVIDAVTTLAHDRRRSEFFRAELMNALRILDEGHIAKPRMLGSWAGAMGQLQFMPSTFAAHAVDADGDGRKDIWGSLPDVFSSAAKYLSDVGWKGDRTWGREVRLPEGFDLELATRDVRQTLSDWQDLGVRRANGADLPIVAGMEGSVILPSGWKGPAFLVYDNFDNILTWNRSTYYAIAVGYLADRLVGLPPLTAKPPENERALSRDEVLEMQRRLNALGFDAGEPDGMVGPATRGAVKAYQKASGLPPDGYPTPALLETLYGAGATGESDAGRN
ncbi:lytic murein transglycosylase [Marivibrio halodurans]|uniref:Lytic murein transglycosylase n=1 Tax=Marivibrio halodurans TaxID=2039722 RepID=A0A8J7RYX2_9PROT|nr:lytic murein transglycosylase [Marivibrio halodurans]MBP5855599.1 lytic murein transglycosylase [Marivibrio halodurans]